MEKTPKQEEVFRVWIDAEQRIVSFHEVEGSQLLEFRDRELFLKCVDQYVARQYRYQ